MGRPPLGVRLTGYTTSGEVIEAEAAVIRTLFQRFAAGDSLKGLAAWLTETKVPTRHGGPWNAFAFFDDPDGNSWAVQEKPGME